MYTRDTLILASRSPRRTALLSMAGIEHEVLVPQGEEAVLFGEAAYLSAEQAADVCKRLAMAKAAEVALKHPDRDVLGADTIVVVDGRCFGKPKDKADAKRMLRALSGCTHHVYTGLCLIRGDHVLTEAVSTAVTFYPWSEEMERLTDAYAESGLPLDKAGAYGIQDTGALLIESIEGDYYNVVGLPLAAFWRMRQRLRKETI